MIDEKILRVNQGVHHDPFEVLGFHRSADGAVIRELLPTATRAEVIDHGVMQRIKNTDVFELHLSTEVTTRPDYRVRWLESDGSWHESRSPYWFHPLVSDLDLHLFNEGRHLHCYQFLGAHQMQIEQEYGCRFALWAPGVRRVSIVGDFNSWHGLRHQMRSRGISGVWELFIPGLTEYDSYKYEILTTDGDILIKSDPYARCTALRPETVSRIPPDSKHLWEDQAWLNSRQHCDRHHDPFSIYEVHLGSWRKKSSHEFLNFHELAEQLIPHVLYLGFTHIELLPIAEHPLDESWGYQVTSYYSPSARFGSADDLRYFIDCCHQAGIGVLLDWVPAHFPKDAFALSRFVGKALYEYTDPKKSEHRDWGTNVFDYGRNEVISFLVSNVVYWIEEFHFDGIRVDAVASMLYLNYSRKKDQWTPNQHGGCENLEAIEFLKYMNSVVHARFPGVLTMAEESTAWPMVSRPVHLGGLGFSMKWNMGWMNDTLDYFKEDPINRKYHHNNLTFGQLYAYSENFILPLSHDEVVHMKRSLLDKMPGDRWQKFANLRLLLCYQFLHPGKKLLFMGAELAQWREWNENRGLDWKLNQFTEHNSVGQLISDLNRIYRSQPALYKREFEPDGFRWIDCHDHEHSILSFIRYGFYGEPALLCLFNFTPVPRYGYRIGVHGDHVYQEIFNSDSELYAGSNLGNPFQLPSEPSPWHDFDHSIQIIIPPLAAVVLKQLESI